MSKHRLTHGAWLVEAEALGRVLYIEETRDGAPTATTRTCFDEDAAREALAEWVRARQAEGWTLVERLEPTHAARAPQERDQTLPPAAQIVARLRPVLSPASARLLKALLARAQSVRFDDAEGGWQCEFAPEDGVDPDERRWFIDAAPAAQIPRQAKARFARFLAVCGGMSCGTHGETGQLVLHTGDGTLHTVGDDALGRRSGFPYSPELFSPIDVNLQAFYLFHPRTGRLLYHDSEGVTEPAATNDPVEAYLRELAERFLGASGTEGP